MTKEETIKRAFEEVGIPFNEKLICDDGWLRIKSGQYYQKYDFVDILKKTSNLHSIRPKSLSGITNNNGWIKVEGEHELPKESYSYWIMQSDGLIQTMKEYEGNKKYLNITPTHYQPIIKPSKPLY